MTITRRGFAGLVTGAALAPRSLGATPAPARRLDPERPADVLHAYRRMRFGPSGEPYFWWLKGTRYAVVDHRPRPLFEMHVGTIGRYRAAADGSFAVTTLEVVFNTDPRTGRLIERWENPFTGETLEMRPVPVGPSTKRFVDGAWELPRSLPGSKIEATTAFGPMVVEDGQVWIRDDATAVVTSTEGDARPFRVNDWATYHARLADVADASRGFVPCDVSFMDLTNWPRWMRMGDRPGTRLSRCFGRKAERWERMPGRYRELLAATYPEIARDPVAALERPPWRFER